MRALQESPERRVHSLALGLSVLSSELEIVRAQRAPRNDAKFKQDILAIVRQITVSKKRGEWRNLHFNVFTVLGFPHSRLERIHSNILGWLLNAEESHNLGNAFAQIILRKYFGFDISKSESYNVTTEYQEGSDRPDIVVEGKDWILLVEVKVGASEGEQQSARYAFRWGTRAKKSFLLWISPGGAKPENEDFTSVSFGEVARILNGIEISGEPGKFARDFTEHIKRELESDYEQDGI